jgi:hypothetical protein
MFIIYIYIYPGIAVGFHEPFEWGWVGMGGDERRWIELKG